MKVQAALQGGTHHGAGVSRWGSVFALPKHFLTVLLELKSTDAIVVDGESADGFWGTTS